MASPPIEKSPPKSLFKLTEPLPPPIKPPEPRNFDDKWLNLFADKTEDSTKEDLLSKLASQEKRSIPPPSTHIDQKKVTPRVVTSIYDFNQAVINLHEGKPVTTQPTTTNRSSIDPFESLSGNLNDKPTNRLMVQGHSFTQTQSKPNTFESLFGTSTTEASTTTTTTKANSKQNPSQHDTLQRPKVVTNPPKSIPNRTVFEDVEDFFL